MSITPLPPRPATLPALIRPVPVSASLAYHASGDQRFGDGLLTPEAREAHPDLVPHLSPTSGHPSSDDVAEAARKLAEAEHVCQPASQRTIAAWCLQIIVLPWHPVSEQQSKASVAAICLACRDLPAAVFTVETAAMALRKFRRWPAPADIYELLVEHARPFLRQRDGLRRVAASKPPTPPPPPSGRSAAVIVAVQATVAIFASERSYNRSGVALAEGKLKPASLSHGALLAVWEQAAQAGAPGADIRVARLRKQASE